MKIPAGEFKAKCLKLLDDVRTSGVEIIVTKRGLPVARVVPVQGEPERPLYGYLKGQVEILGDIRSPIEEIWDAER